MGIHTAEKKESIYFFLAEIFPNIFFYLNRDIFPAGENGTEFLFTIRFYSMEFDCKDSLVYVIAIIQVSVSWK
jgi:hypothetical protein